MLSGCHNPDGNSAIPENPKLSGLDGRQIVRRLRDFKDGDRKDQSTNRPERTEINAGADCLVSLVTQRRRAAP